MAKIAFINIPAHGHTNPTLPVVRKLVQHGHHVLYYTSDEFSEKVISVGADFRAYPQTLYTSKQISQRMHSLLDASLMMMDMSEIYTKWTIAEMQNEHPDLIIYDTTTMWGYIAARVLDIPAICSITHFVLDGVRGYMSFSVLLTHIAHSITKVSRILRWRRTLVEQVGKEHVGGITEYAPLNIVFTSRAFHPPSAFIDDRFQFVGASIDPTRIDTAQSIHIDPTQKNVYISLGTINNLNLDFYRTAFATFKDYPANFILSVGEHTNINQLPPVPDNFMLYPRVPQVQVLQKVDAFITHGGMNSVHEGLYYGVPQVVVPQQMEQLVNAKRVHEVGAGISLVTKPLGSGVKSSELFQALHAVLTNAEYAKQAQHYGKTLQNAGGYQQAVNVIETYLNQQELV